MSPLLFVSRDCMKTTYSGSRTVLNCARNRFYQYANHLPNHLLSIELKYPDFFLPLFDLIRFILYYFVQAELFHANLRFQKEKNFEETLCLQPRQFVSISLHLRLYANYCSSAGFRWRQKCRFWIPRCLPFWAPFLFWLSRFLQAKLQTFHSNVLMRESYEKCCNWLKSRNTLWPHNLIFLISFVLLLSPKQ